MDEDRLAIRSKISVGQSVKVVNPYDNNHGYMDSKTGHDS